MMRGEEFSANHVARLMLNFLPQLMGGWVGGAALFVAFPCVIVFSFQGKKTVPIFNTIQRVI
jgi:hypothetical protein